jgi:hypothetical protein
MDRDVTLGAFPIALFNPIFVERDALIPLPWSTISHSGAQSIVSPYSLVPLGLSQKGEKLMSRIPKPFLIKQKAPFEVGRKKRPPIDQYFPSAVEAGILGPYIEMAGLPFVARNNVLAEPTVSEYKSRISYITPIAKRVPSNT